MFDKLTFASYTILLQTSMNVSNKTSVVIVKPFATTRLVRIHASAKMGIAGQVRDVKTLMSVRMELTNVIWRLRNARTKMGVMTACALKVTKRKKINVLVSIFKGFFYHHHHHHHHHTCFSLIKMREEGNLFSEMTSLSDIDECNTDAHYCNETTSKCQNTIGGHMCVCRAGFNKTEDKCVGQ